MASGKLRITAENRGPLINIATWILLVVMSLTTLVKIFSKWFMVHRLQYDDIYMFVAMVKFLSDLNDRMRERKLIHI